MLSGWVDGDLLCGFGASVVCGMVVLGFPASLGWVCCYNIALYVWLGWFAAVLGFVGGLVASGYCGLVNTGFGFDGGALLGVLVGIMVLCVGLQHSFWLPVDLLVLSLVVGRLVWWLGFWV